MGRGEEGAGGEVLRRGEKSSKISLREILLDFSPRSPLSVLSILVVNTPFKLWSKKTETHG